MARTKQGAKKSHDAKEPVKVATKVAKVDRLVEQNLDLLESGNFADAEIVCNGKTWKVHKLILQSRCPWFEKAFANNWQEAQTGQIDLKDEQPEQIEELLKFIYSGRYTPDLASNAQCISTPSLESSVSLWLTADFFLLPDLKAEIQEYLLERCAATLWWFHDFKLLQAAREAVHNQSVNDKKNLDIFFVDLSNAVEKTYKSSLGRQLYKIFSIFACGLREHWPAQSMWSLMNEIPRFQQDISTALIAIHFPKATNEFVSGGLEKLCVSEAWNAHSVWAAKDFISFRCSECGKESPKALPSWPHKRAFDMTLDPFSLGTRKWCNDCAFVSIKSLLKTMISGWPSGAPGSG